MTHIFETLDIENLHIPAITVFQARLHAEKHEFVEKRMKKWRAPFVTNIFKILDIENLHIPAIAVFQTHFHAE